MTPRNHEDLWTIANIEKLRRLWSEGATARTILAAFNHEFSRSALYGKVSRLGLPKRKRTHVGLVASNMTRRRPLAIPAPTASSCEATADIARPDNANNSQPLVKDFAQLGRRACKWPIGDPQAPGFGFCGRPASGIYCSDHHQVAHVTRAEPHAQSRPGSSTNAVRHRAA